MRLANAVVVQQLGGLARVFAGDQVHFAQHAQRAHGDVFEIADRRGNQIEAACRARDGVFRIGRGCGFHFRLPVYHATRSSARPCGHGKLLLISLTRIDQKESACLCTNTQCTKCGKHIERIEKFSGPQPEEMPQLRRPRGTSGVGAGDSVQGQRLVRDRLRASPPAGQSRPRRVVQGRERRRSPSAKKARRRRKQRTAKRPKSRKAKDSNGHAKKRRRPNPRKSSRSHRRSWPPDSRASSRRR